MFNVFSKAFLDKKTLGKNASATSSAFLKNPNSAFLSKGISETAGGENEKTKHMSLKERLASVRNVQNIMAKKKLETEETPKADMTNNAEGANKEKAIGDFRRPAGNDVLLPRFKNYSAIVNERNTEKQKEEEMEKKLKKRKRRKKHEILMERMKQQGKGNYDNNEENNNGEDEEEENERNNNASAEETMKRRRPGRPSKNRQQEKRKQEDEEGEEEREAQEENKSNSQMRRQYDSFRNNDNSGNNRNSNVSNNAGEPIKQKRKRRKKKEMEALRAQGLIGKGPNNRNNFNRSDSGNNANNTGMPGQEENKVKRRRGRPKLSGNTSNNNNSATNNKSQTNDYMKGMDIRRYCSKNDDNNSTGTNGNITRNASSNNVTTRDDEKRWNHSERGGDKPKNIFNIITSSIENEGFMKKTPNEIEQLEKSYKHNVQTGVTCIPLDYQDNGGGLSIIFMDTNTQYGPVKNYNGFMTFLVLECDAEQFFLETGITNNVIECEKHMQLLISPGDTYTFKNKSNELEAKLLLIACNKMVEELDLKKHIRDPTMNQEKG